MTLVRAPKGPPRKSLPWLPQVNTEGPGALTMGYIKSENVRLWDYDETTKVAQAPNSPIPSLVRWTKRWPISLIKKIFRWLWFGIFPHPAWAVCSCSSGPPTARTVWKKSTGGFTTRWVILYFKHMFMAKKCILCWNRKIYIKQKQGKKFWRLRTNSVCVCGKNI